MESPSCWNQLNGAPHPHGNTKGPITGKGHHTCRPAGYMSQSVLGVDESVQLQAPCTPCTPCTCIGQSYRCWLLRASVHARIREPATVSAFRTKEVLATTYSSQGRSNVLCAINVNFPKAGHQLTKKPRRDYRRLRRMCGGNLATLQHSDLMLDLAQDTTSLRSSYLAISS